MVAQKLMERAIDTDPVHLGAPGARTAERSCAVAGCIAGSLAGLFIGSMVVVVERCAPPGGLWVQRAPLWWTILAAKNRPCTAMRGEGRPAERGKTARSEESPDDLIDGWPPEVAP